MHPKARTHFSDNVGHFWKFKYPAKIYKLPRAASRDCSPKHVKRQSIRTVRNPPRAISRLHLQQEFAIRSPNSPRQSLLKIIFIITDPYIVVQISLVFQLSRIFNDLMIPLPIFNKNPQKSAFKFRDWT